MIELLGKSKDELTELCVSLGEPAYRGGQIYRALYNEQEQKLAVVPKAGDPAGASRRRRSCVHAN